MLRRFCFYGRSPLQLGYTATLYVLEECRHSAYEGAAHNIVDVEVGDTYTGGWSSE